MLRFFAAILCMAVVTASSAQADSVTVMTKSDYLHKSKSQKTVGFVMLGIGAGLVAVAAPGNVDFDTLGALVVVAGAAALVSIPLFISAAKNKRRARAASVQLKMRKIPVPVQNSLAIESYPSLTFRINLGR